MPSVKKPSHTRGGHHLRAWRKHRKISQEKAAERIGLSRPNLSKIENGEVPYEQDRMEMLAALYNCSVGDLIDRDPNEQPRIPIFDLPEGDAKQVHDFIRALRTIRERDADEPPEQQLQEIRPAKKTPARRKASER